MAAISTKTLTFLSKLRIDRLMSKILNTAELSKKLKKKPRRPSKKLQLKPSQRRISVSSRKHCNFSLHSYFFIARPSVKAREGETIPVEEGEQEKAAEPAEVPSPVEAVPDQEKAE